MSHALAIAARAEGSLTAASVRRPQGRLAVAIAQNMMGGLWM